MTQSNIRLLANQIKSILLSTQLKEKQLREALPPLQKQTGSALMPFYAPYMAHLVGLDTAFVCHPGHTGALTLAVLPHWGQLRSFDECITHVATNPYPSNFSKTFYNFLDVWHGLLCQEHRIPVSWSPHWQWYTAPLGNVDKVDGLLNHPAHCQPMHPHGQLLLMQLEETVFLVLGVLVNPGFHLVLEAQFLMKRVKIISRKITSSTFLHLWDNFEKRK